MRDRYSTPSCSVMVMFCQSRPYRLGIWAAPSARLASTMRSKAM